MGRNTYLPTFQLPPFIYSVHRIIFSLILCKRVYFTGIAQKFPMKIRILTINVPVSTSLVIEKILPIVSMHRIERKANTHKLLAKELRPSTWLLKDLSVLCILGEP